jgi:hypothetical protein
VRNHPSYLVSQLLGVRGLPWCLARGSQPLWRSPQNRDRSFAGVTQALRTGLLSGHVSKVTLGGEAS